MTTAQPSIQQGVSLKPYNTFGVDAKAKYFFDAQTMDDLLWIIHQPEFKYQKLILGGGSNMLLTQDYDGFVIKISLKLKWIEKSEGNQTLVSVMAGENWHNFVLWCIENELGGIENLSLIPGNVGTAPIQNIGAYGVEVKSCFHHLEALNIESGEFEIFTLEDCDFWI
ncbi:MAG: FAD-binding protein [Owenweeksia sp.]|nr:FAD-binding protein [Owenweeksia sp.]